MGSKNSTVAEIPDRPTSNSQDNEDLGLLCLLLLVLLMYSISSVYMFCCSGNSIELSNPRSHLGRRYLLFRKQTIKQDGNDGLVSAGDLNQGVTQGDLPVNIQMEDHSQASGNESSQTNSTTCTASNTSQILLHAPESDAKITKQLIPGHLCEIHQSSLPNLSRQTSTAEWTNRHLHPVVYYRKPIALPGQASRDINSAEAEPLILASSSSCVTIPYMDDSEGHEVDKTGQQESSV